MKPLVSIIMPVYNAQTYIEQAINSVIEQTYQNWELIVINDGSTDQTKEKIECLQDKYNKYSISIMNQKEKTGPAKARNLGLQKAQGEYIAFLDADDRWQENKLEKQITYMEENQISFCYTAFSYIDSQGRQKRKVKVPEKLNYSQLLKNTIIQTSTVSLSLKKIKKEEILMPDVRK